MKFFRTDNWNKDFRNDGLLFFTQRIQEMLFYYTDHIYKVPVMNTYMLAQEYLSTAQMVDSGTVNESNLKYILDEFKYTFSKDIVISKNLDPQKIDQITKKLGSSSQSEQNGIMHYVLYLLRDYPEWSKKYIKEIVPQEKEKKKIDQALKCFLPCLYNEGYSYKFIFYYNKLIFHDLPVTSMESLGSFVDRFDFKKRTYDIYVPILKKASEFKSLLNERLGFVYVEDSKEVEDLKYDKNKYIIFKKHLEAMDEQGAAIRAYSSLDLFFRYYTFVSDYNASWIYKTGKVVSSDKSASFVELNTNGFDYDVRAKKDDSGKTSEQIITALLSNARCSFDTIDRAIISHNAAIREHSLTNGYLNLWSVLEILFVSNQNNSKIAEIENKMLPILKNDYLHSLTQDITKYIIENCESSIIDDFRELYDLSNDDAWTEKIVFLDKYDDARKDLYSILSNYPVIRSRIAQLNGDLSRKEDLLRDIERYAQRIEWHLRRLYRARNTIIHTGDTPEHLKQLGEHLHSYVDQCLLEIVVLLAAEKGLCTIENVLIDAQMRNEEYFELLSKKEKIKEDDICKLFDIEA